MHPILTPLTLLLVSNTAISSTPRFSDGQKARTIYNLGKGELNQQAELSLTSYWENPSPESPGVN